MLGREVCRLGVQTMWGAGGDLDSAFLLNFGREPIQNLVLGDITLNLPIQEGDVGTLTAHSRYHHYSGHTDQEIVFGEPRKRHLDMFEGVKKVREGGSSTSERATACARSSTPMRRSARK